MAEQSNTIKSLLNPDPKLQAAIEAAEGISVKDYQNFVSNVLKLSKSKNLNDAEKTKLALKIAVDGGKITDAISTQTADLAGRGVGALGVGIQGYNLVNNWDKLTKGQKARGLTGFMGSSAALAAGGPIGAAVAAASLTVGKTLGKTVDEGLTEENTLRGIGQFASPSGFALNAANDLTGGNFHQNDVNNAALYASGNPIGIGLGIINSTGIGDKLGLDLDFSSGKGKDQKRRDLNRKRLQAFGLADKDFGVTLASGEKFNIGGDKGSRLKNRGINVDARVERQPFDVDFSDARSDRTVGWLNPLATIMGETDQKGRSDLVGMMTNAVQSDSDDMQGALRNAQTLASNAGIDYATGSQKLREMRDKGQVREDEFDALQNGWFDLMLGDHGNAPTDSSA